MSNNKINVSYYSSSSSFPNGPYNIMVIPVEIKYTVATTKVSKNINIYITQIYVYKNMFILWQRIFVLS